jgi:MFS family permease
MRDRPPTSGTRARGKIFYGWWVVAAGSAINVLAGGTYWTGFSIYFLPVTRDLGLSRAATSLAYGLGRMEGGIEGPLAGYLVDRLGPRRMIAAGGILAGLGFILLSLTHSFTTFMIVYVGALTLGVNVGFNHGIFAAVNLWFVRRSGLAMSISTMGMSIGGAIITPAVAYIVLSLGWRTGAWISGLLIIALVVPMSFVIRGTPESMGLLPDGDRAPAIPVTSGSGTQTRRFGRHYTTVDFTAREAIKTRAYWLLALAMGLRISAHTGVFVHLVPLMVWKGQSEATGALVVALVAFTTIPLRLFLGWIGDKWAKQKMVGITMALGAVSLAILLVPGGTLWQLPLFALLFSVPEAVSGLAWSLVGDYFGRRSFATLRGGITTVYSFMSMGVPVFAGWVFDTSGSYYWALIPIVGMYLAAALIFWNIPRPRPPIRAIDSSTSDVSTGQ